MTKASDLRHWAAKCQPYNQLMLLQQQQQPCGVTASTAGDGLSRQSSNIPAVYCSPGMHAKCSAAATVVCAATGCGTRSMQQSGHQQLTISAADVEAPSMQDQQLQAQLPSPVQLYRSASQTTAPGVPPLLLPPVTLMFVSVDGSKVLRKHHVRDAHYQLSQLFMESLRHVPGGYMCRMQVCSVMLR